MNSSEKIPGYLPADSYMELSGRLFRDIYTLFCGRQKCPPLYSFGPAVRECYLLHFCLDGCGDFYANERHYHIEKGQGFLICPNELTFYQAEEHLPWTYAWIGLDGEQVDQYLKLAGISSQHPVFHCSHTDLVCSCIDDMIAHQTSDISCELYIQSILMRILSHLTETSGQAERKEGNDYGIYISRAISYIHKNYQNHLTVQEIANYLSLNRSYLTELFLRTLHLSPQQFLIKYRITKAMHFLMNTDLGIEHIACSCGYANTYSFSKAFKKVAGISPSQYRKEQTTKRSGYLLSGDTASRTYSRD